MECGQDLIGNGRTSLCFRNLERETETQRKAECDGKRERERERDMFSVVRWVNGFKRR